MLRLRRLTRSAEPDPAPRSAPGARAPIVELEGLTVSFGAVDALRDVTGHLSGRAVGLLGPNGAGKTTLLRTLLGFHAPSAGAARILGRDVATEGHQIRTLVGYMPENEAFVADMSAVRLTRLMAELSGLPPSDALERAHEALNYVGLGEARYRKLGTYSLGMRQLVKLAQAIVHGPRLLLLDEPTNGLDPPARRRMLGLIRDIRDSGEVHVIVSSHLLRDVEAACDQVAILREGRLVDQCDLADARRAHDHLVDVETRDDPAPLAAALTAAGCEVVVGTDRHLTVVLPASMEPRDVYVVASRAGVSVRRFRRKQDSLEEIFLRAMSMPTDEEPPPGRL